MEVLAVDREPMLAADEREAGAEFSQGVLQPIGHVSALDANGAEERGDMVGRTIGRVRPGRLVAVTQSGQIDRDAADVFGVAGSWND